MALCRRFTPSILLNFELATRSCIKENHEASPSVPLAVLAFFVLKALPLFSSIINFMQQQ